jgi:hypothetical protein
MNSNENIKECKKFNDKLWKCIENSKTITSCGILYYEFIKCLNKIN